MLAATISLPIQVFAQPGVSIVLSVDWNSTGTKIAVGYGTGLVEVIDSSTGQTLQDFQFPGFIAEVVWSRHNSELLAALANYIDMPGTIHILNTVTEQEIMTLTEEEQLYAITWSPDGNRIAAAVGFVTANPMSSRHIMIWDTATGQENSIISVGANRDILSLDWSPDGSRIAGGEVDGSITVWDANTGTVDITLTGHTRAVQSVTWSPDGSRIASSGWLEDSTIRVWDAATGQSLLTISDYGATNVTWSPDGTRLAAADVSNQVRIWDASTGQLVNTVTGIDGMRTVAWSPDGSKLVFGGYSGTAQVVQFPTAYAGPDQDIADSDSNGLESVSLNGAGSTDADGTIVGYVWTENGVEIATGVNPQVSLGAGVHTITLTVTDDDGLTDMDEVVITVLAPPIANAGADRSLTAAIAWSPDGSMIAVGGGLLPCQPNHPDSSFLHILNVNTLQIVQTLTGSPCWITSIDWSPDGMYLAAANSGQDRGVRVWDVQTAALVSQVQRGGQGVTTVRWSPDGQYLAVAAIDNSNGILNAMTGEFLGSPTMGGDDIDWSPDGTKVASASSYEARIYIGDVLTQQRLLVIEDQPDGGDIEWSPDGTRLATTYYSGDITLRDATTGDLLRTMAAGVRPDSRLIWSHDSRYVAMGYQDNAIRIWDADTGGLHNTVSRLVGIEALDWSPDGSQIAFATADNVIEIITFPIASAGSDQAVINSSQSGSELVTLDGSASSDPDGTIVSYIWSENGAQIATGVNPQVNLGVGVHTITLTVTDNDGLTDTDEVVITVLAPPIDNAGVDRSLTAGNGIDRNVMQIQ